MSVLIGTKSVKGNANLSIFNSLIHLGANPPLYGLISRPDTVKRDTLTNILDTKTYTLNYVNASFMEKAHQVSAKYDTEISEFDAVGFEEEYVENCTAPFVKEAVVKIQMQLEDTIPIPLNGTILLIGSIQSVWIKDEILSTDGFVALHKENVLACSGLDAYYQMDFLGRLSYAKPAKQVEFITKP